MDLLNKNNPIIIDQIANYDYNKVEKNIRNYNNLLNNQQLLNRTLKNNDSENLKASLINFLETRKPIVDNQIIKITELKNDLMGVCQENTDLEQNDLELKNLQETPEMVEIANKLADIENIQREIDDFLEKNGVVKFHQ